MKKLDPLAIRKRIMDIGLKTGCGHIASALSCVDPLCKTYEQAPNGIVILSKGHGALAQYVILNELGKISDSELESYYQDGGLGGHATLNKKQGIYASTGSLGHGLGIGIGYALANPKKGVVVILSDGECDEGSTLECIRIIQKLDIRNIMTVIDVNGHQGFSESYEDLLPLYPVGNGKALPWRFYATKGEGFGHLEDTMDSHYQKVTQELYDIWMKWYTRVKDLMEAMKWDYWTFRIEYPKYLAKLNEIESEQSS